MYTITSNSLFHEVRNYFNYVIMPSTVIVLKVVNTTIKIWAMLSVCNQPNEQRGFFYLSRKYKVKFVGNRLMLAFTTNTYRSSLIFQLNKNGLEHFLLIFCSVKKLPCIDKSLALVKRSFIQWLYKALCNVGSVLTSVQFFKTITLSFLFSRLAAIFLV